jgi:hypothetical protein
MDAHVALQVEYDLSEMMAKILVLLIENKLVTQAMVEEEHKITVDAKVAVYKLRLRLEGAVDINSRRGVGYWISAGDREKLREVLSRAQEEV